VYFENIDYQWGFLKQIPVRGAIFRPSSQDYVSSLSKHKNFDGEILFDPQLYLLNFPIIPNDFSRLLCNLSTYPWFGMEVSKFDSTSCNIRTWTNSILADIENIWDSRNSLLENWKDTVRKCVQYQIKFGCSKIIIPATAISDPESNLKEDFARLDSAIDIASSLTELPLLASIPLQDTAIRHRGPNDSDLIEAIADGISARDNIVGAYVLLGFLNASEERIHNQRIAASLLTLSKMLSQNAGMIVIANYLESFGLIAQAFGAYGYGSGYRRKCKRFSFNDLKNSGGGAPSPKFHSLALTMDFYPEKELERIRDIHLTKYFINDKTPSSTPLLDQLNSGGLVNVIADWAESPNNVSAARVHYSELHTEFASKSWTPEQALDWIQSAEANWLCLQNRFEDKPLESSGSHISSWRSAIESVLNP